MDFSFRTLVMKKLRRNLKSWVQPTPCCPIQTRRGSTTCMGRTGAWRSCPPSTWRTWARWADCSGPWSARRASPSPRRSPRRCWPRLNTSARVTPTSLASKCPTLRSYSMAKQSQVIDTLIQWCQCLIAHLVQGKLVCNQNLFHFRHGGETSSTFLQNHSHWIRPQVRSDHHLQIFRKR